MDRSNVAFKIEPVTPSSGVQIRRRSRTTRAVPSSSSDARTDIDEDHEILKRSSYSSISLSCSLAVLTVLLCLAYLSRVELSSWHPNLHFLSYFDASEVDSGSSYQQETQFPPEKRLEISLSPQNHTHRPKTLLNFEWVITAGFRRPDGVRKRIYLVNNEFPGPTIEARSGDTLKILVRNELDQGEGIAIHWHGLHMENANDMDGAVGFTQCPIRPGGHFVYEFNIAENQHGTFWYHAHDQVQRADGLFGGLVVHRPAPGDGEADIDTPAYDEERLLLIGDWYHRPADDVLKWYMRAGSFGNEPVPDSVVVNYAGNYNCSDAVRALPVDCVQTQPEELSRLELSHEKSYRFRLVNTGTLAGFTIHLPGSLILPFQVDGGNPINNNGSVDSIGILYPGERVDFIASWKSDNTFAWLEIELDDEDFRYSNPALSTTHQFLISFDATAPLNPPPSDSSTIETFSLVNATSSRHSTGFDSPKDANLTFVIYTTTMKLSRLSNVPYGFMNHTSWKPQQDPALPLLSLSRSQWDQNQLVPYIESSPRDPVWVDIVVNNLDDGSHPFHLHGYDFWVLSTHRGGKSYWGSYNPFDAPDGPPGGPFNLVDPVKRDTVFVPRRGYAVIRFRAGNEGIWMFHCHILWHQASGMAMGFQVGGMSADGPLMESLNLSDYNQLKETCK